MKDQLIRVNIRVSKEIHADVARLIPWGLRRNVHEAVLQLILDAIRENGMVVAGAILDGQFKLVRVESHDVGQNLTGGRSYGSTG